MAETQGKVEGAPAFNKGAVAGQEFRALMTYKPAIMGPAVKEAELVTLKLKGIGERQVVVRVEASAPCYTMMHDVFITESLETNKPEVFRASGLGGQAENPTSERRTIPRTDLPFTGEPVRHTANHSYVGVVEAIGPGVRRVKVGDRVIVGPTTYCGTCYQCLHGATELCQIMFGQQGEWTTPIAETEDGDDVLAFLSIGGMSELSVAWEENLIPVFSELPALDLSLLGCQLAAGLAVGMSRMKIEPGSNVVIYGAGAVGASVILSAVACRADQIIVVEPIAYRRRLALELGATTVLDPWELGDGLVPRIQELTKPRTSNRFAGGGGSMMIPGGGDYSIGAVGADVFPAGEGVEKSPDPTAVLPFQQTYASACMGGNVMWLGLANGDVALPPQFMAMTGKIIWPGQQAGINVLRDVPRMISLMETGAINYKALFDGPTYSLDKSMEAIRAIGERTVLTTVVEMNT